MGGSSCSTIKAYPTWPPPPFHRPLSKSSYIAALSDTLLPSLSIALCTDIDIFMHTFGGTVYLCTYVFICTVRTEVDKCICTSKLLFRNSESTCDQNYIIRTLIVRKFRLPWTP